MFFARVFSLLGLAVIWINQLGLTCGQFSSITTSVDVTGSGDDDDDLFSTRSSVFGGESTISVTALSSVTANVTDVTQPTVTALSSVTANVTDVTQPTVTPAVSPVSEDRTTLDMISEVVGVTEASGPNVTEDFLELSTESVSQTSAAPTSTKSFTAVSPITEPSTQGLSSVPVTASALSTVEDVSVTDEDLLISTTRMTVLVTDITLSTETEGSTATPVNEPSTTESLVTVASETGSSVAASSPISTVTQSQSESLSSDTVSLLVQSSVSTIMTDLTTTADVETHCLVSIVLDIPWNPLFADQDSVPFTELKITLENVLTTIYFGNAGFDRVMIIKFERGSTVVYFTCVFNTNKLCIQDPSVLSPIVQELLLSNNTLDLAGFGPVTTYLGSVFEENFFDIPNANSSSVAQVDLTEYCVTNGAALCYNGGVCVEQEGLVFCDCPIGYSGTRCQSKTISPCHLWLSVNIPWNDFYNDTTTTEFQTIKNSLEIGLLQLYSNVENFMSVEVLRLRSTSSGNSIQVEHNVVFSELVDNCPSHVPLGRQTVQNLLEAQNKIFVPGFGETKVSLLLLWNMDPVTGGNVTAVGWLSYCTGRPGVAEPCSNGGKCALRNNSEIYCQCPSSHEGQLCEVQTTPTSGGLPTDVIAGIVAGLSIALALTIAGCFVLVASLRKRREIIRTRTIVERVVQREYPRYQYRPRPRMFIRYTPRMAWWVRPVRWYVPDRDDAPDVDDSAPPTPVLRRRQLNPTLGRQWTDAASINSFRAPDDDSSDSALGRDSRGSSRRNTPFNSPFTTPAATPNQTPAQTPEMGRRNPDVWPWDNSMSSRRSFRGFPSSANSRSTDSSNGRWSWKLGQ